MSETNPKPAGSAASAPTLTELVAQIEKAVNDIYTASIKEVQSQAELALPQDIPSTNEAGPNLKEALQSFDEIFSKTMDNINSSIGDVVAHDAELFSTQNLESKAPVTSKDTPLREQIGQHQSYYNEAESHIRNTGESLRWTTDKLKGISAGLREGQSS
eukprot:Clim_evm84s157 gene=Clim_evmTU84s157